MPPEEHILITGGAGFLGRYILHAFLTQHPSHRYTVLDISPPSTTPPPAFPPNHADVAFLETDVRDAPAVRAALKAARPTVVVHAAGIVPAGAARYSRRRDLRAKVFGVNVEGTRNVLEAARACGSVRAFVYTSSATVVGDDLGRVGGCVNVGEEVAIGGASWVYGESKVGGFFFFRFSSLLLCCPDGRGFAFGVGSERLLLFRVYYIFHP